MYHICDFFKKYSTVKLKMETKYYSTLFPILCLEKKRSLTHNDVYSMFNLQDDFMSKTAFPGASIWEKHEASPSVQSPCLLRQIDQQEGH